MNQAALNAFLQELKASIKKLESVLATTPTEESSLWYPEDPENAYGPWIEHDGKEKPSCSKTGFGQVLFASQRTRDDFDYHWDCYFEYFSADKWCWSNRPDCNPRNKIVAYRLKREQPFVHEEEYEEDDAPVTKKKLGARKAAKKTAIRKKPLYPKDCEDFGPWIENNGVDYRKLAPGTRGQILYSSQRSAKSWNPCIMNFDDVDLDESDEDYVVAYRLLKEEAPW